MSIFPKSKKYIYPSKGTGDVPTAKGLENVGVRCKHCGSTNVRKSRMIASSAQQNVYRCRDCGRHFRLGDNPRKRFTILVSAVIAAILLILIIPFVYYILDSFTAKPKGRAAMVVTPHTGRMS